ncbi:hypothetical protein COY51_05455 [Candidatus Desantisbacteria bacterium CG_4_10_14_0_8_um_filter_39_17]|uniref:Nucleotidyltransferase n=1 Tax=Candidatus Desantisbacteria bacterium CG_4_10_14_0_8_um_filter_39_17 TaxID=1974542 RepID=A0A2H9PAA7_9BACT|nr:MAG: hypothetical protein COY51_05455 [Candidatus Desantisbacteria bacterium CG_4_10_14_0_8_um_filter_39_17]
MKIFERTVKEILKPFTRNGIDYCIIGGLAVIVSGVRRGTADFDIVIPKEKFEKAIEVIYNQEFKLITDIDDKKNKLYYCETVDQAIAYVKITMPKAIKINKGGFNGLFGDIWLKTVIPFEKLNQRAKKYKLYNEQIRIVAIDDLIKLKKSAGRPVDKQDIYELGLLKRKSKKKG